jgi:tRNA A-37 threonylcarbamoyl transferase component Bud32
VVKRHAGGSDATLRELAVLARVWDVQVPRVRQGSEPSALHLDFVPGISGVEAIEAGRASDVLLAIGQAIRRVQSIDPRRFGSTATAGVVSHGDFAPYNVIVSEEACALQAIVDWEAADIRDPLVDLAWCEWQFNRLFPRHAYALPQLFAGYGESPSRVALDAALERRLEALSNGAVSSWQPADVKRYRVVFDDRCQAAAFVAALSRVVDAPLRVGSLASPAEIWAVTTSAADVDVFLNHTAIEMAAAVFQATGGEAATVPPHARLLFLAGHVGALGLDQALSQL